MIKKIIIKPFNIKSANKYKEWWKNNEKFCRENRIPKYPDNVYG